MGNKAVIMILYFSIFIAAVAFLICLIATLLEEMTAEQMFYSILAAIFIPLITFIISFISAYTYFLPTIFAVSRNHPQILPIFFVNFFFGETVIGWIGCMIWATTHRQGRHTHW